MMACELCYPGECTPASHEAAEAAEYEANTCRICGATPGSACDFEEHREARQRRENAEEVFGLVQFLALPDRGNLPQ